MTRLTGAHTSFITDKLNRLTSLSGPFGAASYGYDAWGNLVSHTNTAGPGYTYSLTVTPQNRVSQTGSTDSAFTYDAAGNVLSDGLKTYSWDAENRLHAVNGEYSYVYGPEGERAAMLKNGIEVLMGSCAWNPSRVSPNFLRSRREFFTHGNVLYHRNAFVSVW